MRLDPYKTLYVFPDRHDWEWQLCWYCEKCGFRYITPLNWIWPKQKKTTKKTPDSHCAAWAALNSFHFPNRICWSFTASWAYFWCLPGERGLPQRPKDRLTDSARRSQSRTAARLGKRMFCFLPALIRFDSIYLVGKHKGKFYMSRRAVTVFPLSIIL